VTRYRVPTLADRAATAGRDPSRVAGWQINERGRLTLAHPWDPDEAWTATRYVASRARDADDCRLLLAALGLIDDEATS